MDQQTHGEGEAEEKPSSRTVHVAPGMEVHLHSEGDGIRRESSASSRRDGPGYTSYEQKADARVARTIKKTFVKYFPKINKTIRKKNRKRIAEVKMKFASWLELGKMGIMDELEDIFTEKEIEFLNEIKEGRRKALKEKMGEMEKEMKEANQIKTNYLKDFYTFEMNQILKNNEEPYLQKFNIYSSIWNKIFEKLQTIADQRIAESNRCVNQQIDEKTFKEAKESLEAENNETLIKFKNEVKIIVNKLKGKVFAEELRIAKEKMKTKQLTRTIAVWKTLLEDIIKLFDKIIVSGFKGKPGECNYFLTRNVLEIFKKLPEKDSDEQRNPNKESVQDWIMDVIKRLNLSTGCAIYDKGDDESVVNMSYDKSLAEIDMKVKPPKKEFIIQLHLFQLKKLMEEATCLIRNKPFRITETMEDKSVELKPFDNETNLSSYIIHRLSDAHYIIDRMLTEVRNTAFRIKGFSKVDKNPPFTITTDPETTERVNSLIKVYRRYPDHIRALTNV